MGSTGTRLRHMSWFRPTSFGGAAKERLPLFSYSFLQSHFPSILSYPPRSSSVKLDTNGGPPENASEKHSSLARLKASCTWPSSHRTSYPSLGLSSSSLCKMTQLEPKPPSKPVALKSVGQDSFRGGISDVCLTVHDASKITIMKSQKGWLDGLRSPQREEPHQRITALGRLRTTVLSLCVGKG